MQTFIRIFIKGFGVALILCGVLALVFTASASDTKLAGVTPPLTFWSRPEVLLIAGVVFTAAGYLLKRDRDSIDTKIEANHKDTVDWLKKIDGKVHGTAEGLAELKGACHALRKSGGCPPEDRDK